MTAQPVAKKPLDGEGAEVMMQRHENRLIRANKQDKQEKQGNGNFGGRWMGQKTGRQVRRWRLRCKKDARMVETGCERDDQETPSR